MVLGSLTQDLFSRERSEERTRVGPMKSKEKKNQQERLKEEEEKNEEK